MLAKLKSFTAKCKQPATSSKLQTSNFQTANQKLPKVLYSTNAYKLYLNKSLKPNGLKVKGLKASRHTIFKRQALCVLKLVV